MDTVSKDNVGRVSKRERLVGRELRQEVSYTAPGNRSLHIILHK